MQIIIPTKGRISNQLTYSNLPPELHWMITLVCPKSEQFFIQQRCEKSKVLAQPDPDMGIAEKRKWIINTASDDKIVMLDDDLRFAVRREDDAGLFRKAEPEDIMRGFKELDEILSPEIPHAGFSARGGGISLAAQEGGWQEGKRMCYVLGYHVPTVLANVEFSRVSTHEDFDVTLQLLTKGFPNKVNFTLVVDQKFGNSGGCTQERTIEKNNADVLKLAELFPAYVRVTEKIYKSSTPRMECVVQWKKALEDGKRLRKVI